LKANAKHYVIFHNLKRNAVGTSSSDLHFSEPSLAGRFLDRWDDGTLHIFYRYNTSIPAMAESSVDAPMTRSAQRVQANNQTKGQIFWALRKQFDQFRHEEDGR
jgi:hypothetical protein